LFGTHAGTLGRTYETLQKHNASGHYVGGGIKRYKMEVREIRELNPGGRGKSD